MVNNDSAQLYTIEGFAAALIIVITAFLVMNATSIYTAGDTHINDMQLEALGTDALKMMDTPVSSSNSSPLKAIIELDNGAQFNTMFMSYTNVSTAGPKHDIQYSASYTCRNSDNSTTPNSISHSRNLTGGEHTVRATKWVIVVDSDACGRLGDEQAVLVEVLLWRD